MMFRLAVTQLMQPDRQMVNYRNSKVYFENILITSLRSRRLISRSHLTVFLALQFLAQKRGTRWFSQSGWSLGEYLAWSWRQVSGIRGQKSEIKGQIADH
jgi:hypothetical protein